MATGSFNLILLRMGTAETPVVRKARANRDHSPAAPKERARAKPTGERVEGGDTQKKKDGGARLFGSLFFLRYCLSKNDTNDSANDLFYPTYDAAEPLSKTGNSPELNASALIMT